MGRVSDLVPNHPQFGGVTVEFKTAPKCPCCRREVGHWTTTHLVQYWGDEGRSMLHVKIKDFKTDNSAATAKNENIFQDRMNYSVLFTWLTITPDLGTYNSQEFETIPYMCGLINRILQVPYLQRFKSNDLVEQNICNIKLYLETVLSNNLIRDIDTFTIVKETYIKLTKLK